MARLLLGDGRDFLHQPALAARGIALVNDALIGGFVESADGLQGGLVGGGGVSALKGLIRIAQLRANTSADNLVVDTLALVRADAFDSRTGVSQFRFSLLM